MANFLWATPGALSSGFLDTELNAWALDTTVLSSAINNSSARKTHMDIELHLAGVNLSGETNQAIEVYILNSVDGGTTYQSGETGKSDADEYPSADTLLCTIGVQVETAAQVHDAVKTGLVIPPTYFKLLFIQKAGPATLAATGNTIEYRTYNMADA